MHLVLRIFKKFESARPFTEQEAWLLFRVAAYAEAVGWTLLISGILIARYLTPGNNAAVLMAGQMHGTLFFGYMVAALGLYPSLGWSRGRGLVALIASIPPYGTLLFELWAAEVRHNSGFRTYQQFLLYTVLVTAD